MRDIANAYHRKLAERIHASAAEMQVPLQQSNRYIGTRKPFYSLKAGLMQGVVEEWAKNYTDPAPEEFTALLDSLAKGETSNEYLLIGLLLRRLPALRRALGPQKLEHWLERAEGWAEVDTICQSGYPADEILARWGDWKKTLVKFSRSKNIHVRRASLVLLTMPVRESADERLSNLSFSLVARLEREREILITKAVSWLLRSLIKHHRDEVEMYLAEHNDTLPKIALRETKVKLLTGTKAGKRRVLGGSPKRSLREKLPQQEHETGTLRASSSSAGYSGRRS